MTSGDTPATDQHSTLEDLASLPTIHHPTVSPEGDRVALYYDGSGRNELHVIDVDTGDRRKWSDGEVPRNARWHVEWAASGDRVFFHRDADGNEQNDLSAISPVGAVESVLEMDGQLVLGDVGERGRSLLVGSNRDGQLNAYRYDLETGTVLQVTNYDRAVHSMTLSPTEEQMAYVTNETETFENLDVYVAAADGSDARNLEIGKTGAEATVADWGPDGNRLLVGDNSRDLTRCGVYDLRTGEVTWFGDLEYEEDPVVFMPDGERFLARRTRNVSIRPVVYDLETGDGVEFDVPAGVTTFGRAQSPVIDDTRVLVEQTTPSTRPAVLVYDTIAHEYEPLFEAEYGPFDPASFVDATSVTFESDGVPETAAAAVELEPAATLEIQGLLYDAGTRPSPLIVMPHGGPRAADYKSFDLYTQFLALQGYSVLQVNYRGSAGRGRSFVEALYDDWGGAEQGDIARGVEYVRETYDWIDENKIAVFGGSYGGYSAYWQLVQYPELYEAGVAWIGPSDLVDMYETTMPHFRTELLEKYLGTPEDAPNLYDERSPVTHVRNIESPLLIVHGTNDRRVPISQARIMRDALVEAGYELGEDGHFEYDELGEEGHASSDIDQKIRLFELLADFLERRFA
ncbi:MAG: S9 family peptidase [Halodesulfurarchaeum sp.]